MLHTSAVNDVEVELWYSQSPRCQLISGVYHFENLFECILISLNGNQTSVQVGLEEQHYPYSSKAIAVRHVICSLSVV